MVLQRPVLHLYQGDPLVLSPAERRKLVEAPFNSLGCHRLTTSYPHAGTLLDRGRAEDNEHVNTLGRKLYRDGSLAVLELDEVTAIWGD